MLSDAPRHLPCNDLLRQHLAKWAARLTNDADEQRRLIDQTITVAIDDPNFLEAKDVDGALVSVMERLISSDLSQGPSDAQEK